MNILRTEHQPTSISLYTCFMLLCIFGFVCRFAIHFLQFFLFSQFSVHELNSRLLYLCCDGDVVVYDVLLTLMRHNIRLCSSLCVQPSRLLWLEMM